MPIYAYKCASCHHADDVMQKMSDPLLTKCPACGAETYAKQLTAPGFALKGSGWYVTDFRGGNNGAAKADADTNSGGKPALSGDAKPAGNADGKSDAKVGGSATSETNKSSPQPTPAPAAAAPAPAASSPSST